MPPCYYKKNIKQSTEPFDCVAEKFLDFDTSVIFYGMEFAIKFAIPLNWNFVPPELIH